MISSIRASICALTMLSLVFAAGSKADAQTPAGKIIFVESYDTNATLWSVDPDGNNLTQIAKLPFTVDSLSLSPDEKSLAYTSKVKGVAGGYDHGALFIMDVDGKNSRKVKPADDTSNDSAVKWSPTGNTLLYYADGRGATTINTDGSNDTSIVMDDTTLNATNVESPSWDATGKRVIFVGGSYITTFGQLYITDVDGQHTAQWTTTPIGFLSDGVAWSPDGTQAVFPGLLDPTKTLNQPIFVANADGSNPHLLTNSSLDTTTNLVWSPDGQQVAMVDLNSILAVNADGSNLHVVLLPADFTTGGYTIHFVWTRQ